MLSFVLYTLIFHKLELLLDTRVQDRCRGIRPNGNNYQHKMEFEKSGKNRRLNH